jgi:hypothetical protein
MRPDKRIASGDRSQGPEIAYGRAANIRADAERNALRARHQTLFDDGARASFLGQADGPREKGGYPLGFHKLPLDARNAWFAGWNKGRCDREAVQ